MEYFMMCIGLGFFLFVVWFVVHDSRRDQERLDMLNERDYDRRLNEKREFGYTFKNPDFP